jgi:subtilisin family serine protease
VGWQQYRSAGLQYRGEGTVVAVLDTGINFGSPSFAATAPVDGYVHSNPHFRSGTAVAR